MKSRVLGLSLATFLAMTAAASADELVADQGVLNGVTAPVTNQGVINSGGHVGDAFSASVGATGAVGQVSATHVNQVTPVLDSALAYQDIRNDGAVNNLGVIGVGRVNGAGASITVSGVGSAASVGSTGIGSIVAGNITADQTSFNSANVKNDGSIVSNAVYGQGASIAVSAVGAIAQASVTNINATGPMLATTVVSATQTVMNSGAVNNIGSVNARTGAGSGSSLSISAVGAAGSVGASSIR